MRLFNYPAHVTFPSLPPCFSFTERVQLRRRRITGGTGRRRGFETSEREKQVTGKQKKGGRESREIEESGKERREGAEVCTGKIR